MVNNGISGVSGGSISGAIRELGSSNNGGTATYGYSSSSRQVYSSNGITSGSAVSGAEIRSPQPPRQSTAEGTKASKYQYYERKYEKN